MSGGQGLKRPDAEPAEPVSGIDRGRRVKLEYLETKYMAALW
jgi:hypothetical protein